MRLEKIRSITGEIELITGLHIGAGNETIEIGGLDQAIIKNPLTGEPYVPGSSLKGKFRSLIEISKGQYSTNGDPCKCGKASCVVCPVFGTAAGQKANAKKDGKDAPAASNDGDAGQTRIIVRDARLTEEWKKKFDSGELPMEIKYENTINRIWGTADNPRPLERVPAGVSFKFSISVKKFDGDPDSYFDTVIEAMRLLEADALGGSGSRGSGQIRFSDIHIDSKLQEKGFLKTGQKA